MGRDVPFDQNKKCDECGKPGAWDFMGDYVCPECYEASHEAEAKECDEASCEDKREQPSLCRDVAHGRHAMLLCSGIELIFIK